VAISAGKRVLRLPLAGLKHWRLRRGLSQRDLTLRADLSQDHLWKIESGRRWCNPSVAQHLADLLKVDLLDPCVHSYLSPPAYR
jgi:transcriptional regulator with XRE-family HTH domain